MRSADVNRAVRPLCKSVGPLQPGIGDDLLHLSIEESASDSVMVDVTQIEIALRIHPETIAGKNSRNLFHRAGKLGRRSVRIAQQFRSYTVESIASQRFVVKVSPIRRKSDAVSVDLRRLARSQHWFSVYDNLDVQVGFWSAQDVSPLTPRAPTICPMLEAPD